MTSRNTEIFFEVFESLPRQGPGNFACAQRALSCCHHLPATPQILDVGCGSGAQTLHLAALTNGTILAIDHHPPLIEKLQKQLDLQGLTTRVKTQVGDIAVLAPTLGQHDLVWSEGALYTLGLETALPLCAGWLRPGGYLVFTEAVWRTPEPPPDVRAAFADYATMGWVDDVVKHIHANDLELVEHFDLPDAAWWDDFYAPLERRITALRGKYVNDAEANAALDTLANEPAMYRRSGEHYGYTFFIARRVNRANQPSPARP